MDDFLEIDPARCGCFYVGRTILPPAGRVSDLWRFGDRIVTPRQAIETVDSALGVPASWQAEASPAQILLKLGSSVEGERAERAIAALRAIVPASIRVRISPEPPPSPWPKRRRLTWSGIGG
jgi:hypothetical protein